MHTRGEHTNSTQKGPRWGSNLELVVNHFYNFTIFIQIFSLQFFISGCVSMSMFGCLDKALCCVIGGCCTKDQKNFFLCSDCLIHTLSSIKTPLKEKERGTPCLI